MPTCVPAGVRQDARVVSNSESRHRPAVRWNRVVGRWVSALLQRSLGIGGGSRFTRGRSAPASRERHPVQPVRCTKVDKHPGAADRLAKIVPLLCKIDLAPASGTPRGRFCRQIAHVAGSQTDLATSSSAPEVQPTPVPVQGWVTLKVVPVGPTAWGSWISPSRCQRIYESHH